MVSSTIYPQTQLPSIRSIVGEADLDQYFKEYDLHDPFYQYIQPEFFVTEDMAKYDIANIVVTAIYDDDLKSTLTFTPKDPGPKKTDKWFIKPELGRAYRYHYTVNFTGMQARPYLSGDIQVKDDLVVTINAAQSGIVYADISTLLNPLGWEVFSQVVVKTQYEDKEHSVPLKQYTQVISDKNPPVPFIYPIGTNVEKAALLFGRLLCAGRRQPDLPPAGRGKQPAAARLWRNARQSDPDRQRPAEAAEIHHHLQTVAKRRFADHL